MVTKQEMSQFANAESAENGKDVYKVTNSEMFKYDTNKAELSSMIADCKKGMRGKNGLSSTVAYGDFEELCSTSADTIKKSITGTTKITRTFLYKFTVGLCMSIDEANTYFALCGGTLREEEPADFICMSALRDQDDVDSMVEEFEKYLNLSIGLRKRKDAK